MKSAYLIVIVFLFLLAVNIATAKGGEPNLKVRTAQTIVATWNCQDRLERPRTRARSPWKPHSISFRRAELNRWQNRWRACTNKVRVRSEALRTGDYSQLSNEDLYGLADQAVKHGAVYGVGWGAASPILKAICYEAVRREFARYGTSSWATHIVNRESGCNPGAVNVTYSSWDQRAQCIAQLIPHYHRWVDYARCKRDLRYSVWVFVRLSRGGSSTSPWNL